MKTHYRRYLDFENLLLHRSIFLFGPRQTGKTTYINKRYPKAKYFNLLESNHFRELSTNPEIISLIAKSENLIVIDEIQKLPSLLNEVQNAIDKNSDVRFILTGSSARKLKRADSNLLGGRALQVNLFPLSTVELGEYDLNNIINKGSLPHVYNSSIPIEDLNSYISLYLQQEISNEGLVRKIEDFSRFIEIAALSNAREINYTSIGNDAQISPRTVQNYFEILEDTLVGSIVKPYHKSKKRKLASTPKFYFFDLGVVNAILKRNTIHSKTEVYGELLEQLVYLELKAYISYHRLNKIISFFRTTAKHEIDFLIEDEIAIEVKSKNSISSKDYKNFKILDEEVAVKKKFVLYTGEHNYELENGIKVINIYEFFRQLWQHQIIYN